MDFTTAVFAPNTTVPDNERMITTTVSTSSSSSSSLSKFSSSSRTSSSDCCFQYIPIPSPSPSSTTTPIVDPDNNNNYNINNNRDDHHHHHLGCQPPSDIISVSSSSSSSYQLSYDDMIQTCLVQHFNHLHLDCIATNQHIRNALQLFQQQEEEQPSLSSSLTLSSLPPRDGGHANSSIHGSTTIQHPSPTIARRQQQQQQQKRRRIDIVVAYIVSSTNIDYLISILAAIRTSTTTNDTNHGNGTNIINNNNEYYDYQLLPVLIPTKWTVSEMVAVLQLPLPSSISQQQQQQQQSPPPPPPHITILLHDAHHQSITYQVQEQLLVLQHRPQQHGSNHRRHIVDCCRLPNYAHDLIMANHCNTIAPPLPLQRFQQQPPPPPTTASNPTATTTSMSPVVIIDPQEVSKETAMIVFTSGTTSGISRGVCISHRAMYVQCQMKQSACFPSSNFTQLLFGTTVPVYHIGGIINYYATWFCHGTLCMPLLLLSQQPHLPPVTVQISFDPYTVFSCLLRNVNTLVVVPTMLHAMQLYYTNERQQQQRCILPKQFIHVTCILIGGQSASTTILTFIRCIFPNAQIIQTYACTEATSSLTYFNVTTRTATTTTTTTTTTTMTAPTSTPNNDNSTTASDVHSTQYGVMPMNNNIGQCVGCSPSNQIIELFLWDSNDQTTTTTSSKINNKIDLLRHCDKNGSPPRPTPTVITKPYTPGIIVSRGPHIMNGYWTLRGRQNSNSSNNAAAAPSNTEYLITNDIGYWGPMSVSNNGNMEQQQQQLYYLGRRNTDTIRTGGETVWCTEVEQVLQQHARILECSVFGLPDPQYYGEVVCCAVVVAAVAAINTSLSMISIETIRSFCAEKGLTGYKRPRHLLLFVVYHQKQQQERASTQQQQQSVLPRNANGKVLKYQLQQKLNELLLILRRQQHGPGSNATNTTTTSIVHVNDASDNNDNTHNLPIDVTRMQSKL